MSRAGWPEWGGYELRRLGGRALALPLIVLLLFGGMALVVGVLGGEERLVARLLVAAVELGLPLAAGVAAAGVVGDDPAVDLQLAVATRYRRTLARRLGLLVVGAAVPAMLWTAAVRLTGYWAVWVPGSILVGQLVWLAPLLWFVAVGALLAVLLGNRATSGALLAGVWGFELLFREAFLGREWLRPVYPFATTFAPGADFWLTNRLALVATAVVIALGAGWLAARTDLIAEARGGGG